MSSKTYYNPVTKVKAQFLKSTADTGGAYTLLQSKMEINTSNLPPYHYHTKFTELFTIVEGELNMMVGKDKKTMILKKGESYRVKKKEPHTFWNASDNPVVYQVKHEPACQFEKALKISHSLAAIGKAGKGGTPKNILHIAMLAQMGNTYLYNMPLWLQWPIYTLLNLAGIVIGVKKKLEMLIHE